MNLSIILLLSLLVLSACGNSSARDTSPPAPSQPERPAEVPDPVNLFDAFLEAPFAPADGFDFPFGDGDGSGVYTDKATGRRYSGWYVATDFAEQYDLGIHPGEDWNGVGGDNTDLGQDVFAVANGRVVEAKNFGKLWGNMVVIEHIFYENNERKMIRSVYAHLNEIAVRAGEEVRRRQRIGAIGRDPDGLYSAHLHLELRWDASLEPTYWPSSHQKDVAWVKEHYTEPTAFVRAHRRLPVPQQEKVLIVVDQSSYMMRLYKDGEMVGEYDVSFGQSKGRKRLQRDNRTPKGIYFVIGKQRGKFEGMYGGYYGGHWMKINYPNSYDAAWGRAEGHITASQEKTITERWRQRKATLEGTKLGGGIGFHGWIEEWENDGPRHLSWGCVVMHIRDIKKIYDQVPEGAMVVIL
jgi:murein DD-endopeptidase MepM/ murein hydrolase activator NlpD